VFQYLGTIRRPRQIGFVTLEGRTIYDFASGRASIRNGEWRRPADLAGPQQAEFRDLVHYWERLAAAGAIAR
jgi:hypothetical protein